MTDVTGLDPLSLGELDGGVHCFGEFGASESARTMKIGSFFIDFVVLSAFGFCFFFDHIILFALKKRSGCSLEIFAFCVIFSIFIWPLKTPFLIVLFQYVTAGLCGLRKYTTLTALQ